MIRRQLGILLLLLAIVVGSGAAINPVFSYAASPNSTEIEDAITMIPGLFIIKPWYYDHTYKITLSRGYTYDGCKILDMDSIMIKINHNGSIMHIPIYNIISILEENQNASGD